MTEIDTSNFGEWEEASDLDPDWAENLPPNEWIKWDMEGKVVEGWISRINLDPSSSNKGITGKYAPDEGDPFVEIRTSEGTQKMVVVTLAKLRRKLGTINPAIGDFIEITYTHDEDLEDGHTLKHFNVRRQPYQGTPEERKAFVASLPVKKAEKVAATAETAAAENLAAEGLT